MNSISFSGVYWGELGRLLLLLAAEITDVSRGLRGAGRNEVKFWFGGRLEDFENVSGLERNETGQV